MMITFTYLKVSDKFHWTGQRDSPARNTVVKNSKNENDQQDLAMHISSCGARCWDPGSDSEGWKGYT